MQVKNLTIETYFTIAGNRTIIPQGGVVSLPDKRDVEYDVRRYVESGRLAIVKDSAPTEQPKQEAPAPANVEEPKQEEPKQEEPKQEEPKQEEAPAPVLDEQPIVTPPPVAAPEAPVAPSEPQPAPQDQKFEERRKRR